MRRRDVMRLALMAAVTGWAARPSFAQEGPGESAEQRFTRLLNAEADRLTAEGRAALLEAYRARDFAPAFVEGDRLGPRARALLARLERAAEDGLDPSAYHRPTLAAERFEAPEAAAAAEIALAASGLRYARHALQGRLERVRALAPFAYPEPPPFDAPVHLAALMTDPDPAAVLDSLHPRHPRFLALKARLDALMADRVPLPEAEAEWERLPEGGLVIRLGSRDARVPALRRRFALAPVAAGREETMDAALVGAVRQFQSARGLPATGIVGPATLSALNRAPDLEPDREQEIAAVLVNMERWRWLPRDLGARHVWVNIPEALIRVVEDEVVRFTGRGVIGREETPTPVFSHEMSYLVVNPSWTVPPGIARRDFMPLLNNPEALARRGIQVVRTGNRVTFRQPPGERNALGRIKFMFPNPHAIYLHDTPARGYFQRERRLYSNGCVRVDEPLKFAEAAFRGEPQITATRLAALFGDVERGLRLRQRVPIHLAYTTLEVEADGRVTRHEDVYGLDRRMRALLSV